MKKENEKKTPLTGNDELFASYRRARRPARRYWVVAGVVFFTEKAAAEAVRELADRTSRR